jgi:5-deoxy-glucuronate isomerase
MTTYFTTVSTAHGLNRLPFNPCKLLDFAYLTLHDGERWAAGTGDREFLAVILGGKGDFAVAGQEFKGVGARPNVFAGKPYAVYLPCGVEYAITARGRLEVALLRVWGAANFSRNYQQILTVAGQPDLPARRLVVGETYVPSGNWATYPPHKHEVDDLPREAFQEEMYFFKVSPPDGFGMVRYYNNEIDAGYIIKDNTILMAPNGYHTNNSAPGYTCYFLWFMAGEQRVQAVSDDPALSWVGRTVPMLKALGH